MGSLGSRFALRPAPPTESSCRLETPAEGTRCNSWARREPLQSPSRKGRRQTLDSCLVQPAREVDASFPNQSLAAVSQSVKPDELYEKLESFSPVRGAPS